MALKDLVIDTEEKSEELIEEVVRGLIGYDIRHKTIHFLPSSSSLGNQGKVLLYLSALRGWPFVCPEETIQTDATPSEIEKQTGIPGGSLRPMLRKLLDRRLVIQIEGRYGLLPVSLPLVKAEIKKPDPLESFGNDNNDFQGEHLGAKSNPKKRAAPASRNGKTLQESFNTLVSNGWFDEGKSITDLQEEFAKKTIIVELSSITKYLINAIRDGKLTRAKVARNGKQIWFYTTAK